jgi:hypothetical protein
VRGAERAFDIRCADDRDAGRQLVQSRQAEQQGGQREDAAEAEPDSRDSRSNSFGERARHVVILATTYKKRS